MDQENTLNQKLNSLDIEKDDQDNQQQNQGPSLTKLFVFEFIGTMIFAYGIVCSNKNDILISAFLYAGIFVSCKVSGGHVNPAVTNSFLASHELDQFTGKVYQTAQYSGAFFGAWLAYLIVGQVNSPQIGQQPVQWIFADFLGEVVGTFIFALFIHIQVHKDTRITDNDVIGIGFIVLGLYLGRMYTYHSGGCLNPAMGVSLGIFASWEDKNWDRMTNVWIFVFAPSVGSTAAAQFYNSVYKRFYPKKE